ncbi:hypothetical protein CUMW_110480 [Citrus unshiu]|nr:hypothetical protein CUMW_110480 [Citrus unshiu]
MIPTYLNGLLLLRDHQRLLMRVGYSSLLLLFLSNILCNLHKCGF